MQELKLNLFSLKKCSLYVHYVIKEISLWDWSFNYLNFTERKSAYLFLDRICKIEKNVLIYPSGSIYTSIVQRFSKSVSKLSKINNLKVIAWKFLIDDKTNIDYDRNIVKYILKRICSDKLVLRIEKVRVFYPWDYASYEELHSDLCLFYEPSWKHFNI